ncbi:hypothetical protein ACWV26_11400 [Rummeliibacillus sp. JY-2-4R]
MKFVKQLLFLLVSFLFIAILIFILVKQVISIKGDSNFYTSLSAISTGTAALGSVCLLFVTYFTFLETRRQRISREEPIVTLRLIPDNKNSNFLNIVLKNSGGGPAYDLQAVFSPDLPYGDTSLNNLNMFKRMPLLDSGEEVVFFYDSLIDYIKSPNPKLVTAYLSYYTFPKEVRNAKKFTRSFEINFEERYGQRQLVKKDMNNLVNELEELKHAIIISTMERNGDD